MMVMVVTMVASRRHHDDARSITAIGVMMVVMVMMAQADDELRQLDIRVTEPEPISSTACSSDAAFGIGSSRSAKEFARSTSLGAGLGVGAA